MTYSSHLALIASTLAVAADLPDEVRQLVVRRMEQLLTEVSGFFARSPAPTGTLDYEQLIADLLRGLGRDLVGWTYNRLEGDSPKALPYRVRSDGEEYRRVNRKTPHRVDTPFGPIVLSRHWYRPADRESPEAGFAPVERALGVIEGTSPALAEAAARYAAEAGATQRSVQERLRTGHGVAIGTGRLRNLLGWVSGEMAEARHEFQVDRLVGLLEQAEASEGEGQPVLSVGRDGITLREHQHGLFEVASVGTVSVADRSGERLGTVYLGHAPEHYQPRITADLTRPIEAVLRDWTGPCPRLAYVTDAGDNETNFYDDVLEPMTHPRTGEPLEWQRVIDFYHAMGRVWSLAGALFGTDTRGGNAWARKMRRWLKEPGGLFRVLHSAAALRHKRATLSPTREEEYRKAYNYLQTRSRWMQYHAYKRDGLPIGSGVTEAACRTVVTQRLKLSGMKWSAAGAEVILGLRVVLLSRIWELAYRRIIEAPVEVEIRTAVEKPEISLQLAW